ncbi:hypothetical protein EDD80_10360 [Anseongella ginsenosidimutans]|uniref:Uncharacterized protein n=1 Tax=Anseongella ginsenosidimutans TaxID=496056 RepID=A0A4R3KUZ7_9SPHI|nr:hypothetical protein EDD80_10360 [Anseongella ginsenosidimutans]
MPAGIGRPGSGFAEPGAATNLLKLLIFTNVKIYVPGLPAEMIRGIKKTNRKCNFIKVI